MYRVLEKKSIFHEVHIKEVIAAGFLKAEQGRYRLFKEKGSLIKHDLTP